MKGDPCIPVFWVVVRDAEVCRELTIYIEENTSAGFNVSESGALTIYCENKYTNWNIRSYAPGVWVSIRRCIDNGVVR